MANNILDIQIAYPAGNKTPIITGTNAGAKRLSFYNVAKLIWGLLTGIKYSQGAAYLQYQTTLVAATGTVTPAAVQVGDTLTIAGTALTAAQKRASATATAATVLEGTTLTVNGVVFTAVNGAVTLGDPTFDCSGTDTACATSIAAQVNAYVSPLISGIVAAKSSAAVVTLYAVTQGTGGNSITLTSSDGVTLAVTGSGFLANGAALTNNTFDYIGTDVTTGQALAAAILASTTAAIQRVTATASSSTGVVTLTAKVAGVAGNAITTVGTAVRLAAGAATLTNGSAGEPVRLVL